MNETFARVLCEQGLRGVGRSSSSSSSSNSRKQQAESELDEGTEVVVDSVWIHDYHLSLVPKMIEERGVRGYEGGER
tara:strand:- start:26 stop:256 length:231 start_codon:yes stop_codon:yes gene_type:complete